VKRQSSVPTTALSPTASATTRSSPSGATSLSAWPTKCSRPSRIRTKKATSTPFTLWRTPSARFETADPPAFRHARLMAKPSGEVIETPITSNFREALPCCSTSSRRTARARLGRYGAQNADSGYLTRRLVDVAQDVIINERGFAALPTAFMSSPSSKPGSKSSRSATASWAAFPSTRSRTSRARSSSTSARKSPKSSPTKCRARVSSACASVPCSLANHAARLRALLWPQPRHRPHG